MAEYKIKSSLFKKTPAILLSVLFLFGAFAPGLAAADLFAVSREYVIKLKSSDNSILKSVGSNIKKEFVFSSNPQFQNIYKFSSWLALGDLESQIGSQAVYLQPDNKVAASAVLDNSDLLNSPSRAITANDPGFTSNPANIDKQWAIPKTGFDYAWSKTTGSNYNVVAIIDTGLDATHEDLQNLNLIPGYNFLTNQNIVGRMNSDDNGHGTLVAGILGASANNGIGVAGTNWVISVMPLKALDSTGKGDSASIAQAIVWAADHGANFINLSLGGVGFGHDTVLVNAISYAFKKNILIVAAAGNDSQTSGSNLDVNPVYPVCDDGDSNMVLGIAAVDQNDLKADFSDYGKNCVDVSAPGKRILSTINYDPLTKTYAPNSYAYVSGTSVAVPFVVGQAALIKALNPNATNVQIRDQILSTADPIDNLNLSQCGGSSCRGLLGAGRINVRASVDQKIAVALLSEGDLATAGSGQPVYQIIGSQKRQVSAFVLGQKFSGRPIKSVTPAQLQNFSDGPFVAPDDGVLVKGAASPAVYYISNAQKLPITYRIFLQHKFNFSQVVVLSDAEMASWLTGSLLPPAEGTLVRSYFSPAIYWVVGGSLHFLNKNFYLNKGLNVFPTFYVSPADLAAFPKGDVYVN